MNTAMTREELEQILDQALQDVTEHTAGVRLRQKDQPLGQDLCTVHITFDAGLSTSLTLCADTALLARMARNALGEEALTDQDLEDFGKEYFNILCGKIAAVLFQNTKVPARFSVPAFYRGRYAPENHQAQFMLTYANEHQEGAQLTHHVPRSGEDGADRNEI